MPSPFAVDTRLSLDQREEFVAFCGQPGTTVNSAMAWLKARGIKISHGAVGGWMNHRRQLVPFAFSYSGGPANAREGRRRIAGLCSRLPADQVRMIAGFAEFLLSVHLSHQANQPGHRAAARLSQFERGSKDG
jgi:hypothetical protein